MLRNDYANYIMINQALYAHDASSKDAFSKSQTQLWISAGPASLQKTTTMTSHEILKADALDILFEGRNKLYGAYYLRKYYHNNLAISLAIAVSSVFLLLLLIPGGKSNLSVVEDKPDVIVTTVVIPPTVLPPPLPPPPTVAPPPRAASAAVADRFLIVATPDPAKEMQAVTDLADLSISNSNSDGPIIPDVQTVEPPKISAVGTAANEETKEAIRISKQPEFPGGMKAWAAFLNRHLQTPEDLAAGEKRMVMISFFVDAQGMVTGFKVAQSGGAAFDNEVIRVLKKMPKWNPAVQNGHPIAITFSQPVTFVGAE